MPSELSQSMEDYLEAIARLIEINGHAHTKEIAQLLQVKLPSVTGALRQLSSQGYIVYNSRYPVELTPSGRALAREVMHRHQVLSEFFIKVLGLSAEQASESACHLEHVVDNSTIERFVLFSEAISCREDAALLRRYLTEAFNLLEDPESRKWKLLARCPENTRCQVVHCGCNIAPDAKVPAKGEILKIQTLSLDKRYLNLECSSGNLVLPVETAENIWVKTID